MTISKSHALPSPDQHAQEANQPWFLVPQISHSKTAFASPVDSRRRFPQSVQKINDPMADILIIPSQQSQTPLKNKPSTEPNSQIIRPRKKYLFAPGNFLLLERFARASDRPPLAPGGEPRQRQESVPGIEDERPRERREGQKKGG